STLINNLKTASSRRTRNRFAEHLKPFYQKPYFWHRAYYVGSVGGATLETVQRYVEAQGTTEKAGRRKTKPPAFPLLPFGLRRGMLGQMFKDFPISRQQPAIHFSLTDMRHEDSKC
ncbi:MAG: IS200/IS605 family transposase, partial [Leptospirillum sp.]